MALPCNEARGEVAVTVNGVDLVVVAETQRLAFLSKELECQSWKDLVERVNGAELGAMYAVLNYCVVRGNLTEAIQKMKPRGAFALAGAMTQAMKFELGEDEPAIKNAEGAKGKS